MVPPVRPNRKILKESQSKPMKPNDIGGIEEHLEPTSARKKESVVFKEIVV